jgi:hypothetical protein
MHKERSWVFYWLDEEAHRIVKVLTVASAYPSRRVPLLTVVHAKLLVDDWCLAEQTRFFLLKQPAETVVRASMLDADHTRRELEAAVRLDPTVSSVIVSVDAREIGRSVRARHETRRSRVRQAGTTSAKAEAGACQEKSLCNPPAAKLSMPQQRRAIEPVLPA